MRPTGVPRLVFELSGSHVCQLLDAAHASPSLERRDVREVDRPCARSAYSAY
jgi:hypothetical protein